MPKENHTVIIIKYLKHFDLITLLSPDDFIFRKFCDNGLTLRQLENIIITCLVLIMYFLLSLIYYIILTKNKKLSKIE